MAPGPDSDGTHGVYLVTGHRQYRGHDPGDQFEARLDPLAEQRAIQRGAIRLLERIIPTLPEGDYRLPDDWPPAGADTQQTKGAERRSSHR